MPDEALIKLGRELDARLAVFSLEEVERYTEAASRRKTADAAMRKLII